MIPPGGFFKVDDVLTALGISNNYGPLMIESMGGQPLAAVSRVYDPTHHTSGFFQAIPY